MLLSYFEKAPPEEFYSAYHIEKVPTTLSLDRSLFRQCIHIVEGVGGGEKEMVLLTK